MVVLRYLDVMWGVKMEQQNSGPAAASGPVNAGSDGADYGANIVTLLRRSADLADGNSRYAVNIARQLSHLLFVAEGKVKTLESRVVALEAEVAHHRENSERAESWLSKISQELQERATHS
jgi:hypothetical protein